jgi:hypothetical protein
VTDNSGTSTAWLDYAGLGADKWGVYLTGNYFYFSGGFRGSYVQTINPDIFSGGSTNGWSFKELKWPGGAHAFALQPAEAHSGSSSKTTYFVNVFSGAGSEALVWKLTGNRGAGGSAPTLTKTAIKTRAYFAIGRNAKQPGSDNLIDGGGVRIMNAVYCQNNLYYSITTDTKDDGKSSGWITTKLNTSTNSKAWDHLLHGGKDWYWFYPGITLKCWSKKKPIAVFGGFTHATRFSPGGLVKIYDNHASSNAGPFQIVVQGKGPYSQDRWGDYMDASYDWYTGNAWGVVLRSGTSPTDWHTQLVGRKLQ